MIALLYILHEIFGSLSIIKMFSVINEYARSELDMSAVSYDLRILFLHRRFSGTIRIFRIVRAIVNTPKVSVVLLYADVRHVKTIHKPNDIAVGFEHFPVVGTQQPTGGVKNDVFAVSVRAEKSIRLLERLRDIFRFERPHRRNVHIDVLLP